MKLTVIIPTYNEANNLPKIAAALFDLPLPNINILIVDDNSQDGTGEIADNLSRKYPGKMSVIHRAGKLGLGTAYIEGFQRAIDDGADFVCQMDADFSHPPQKVAELFAAIEDHDVVIGSRYVRGGQLDEDWPFWRKALSAFGNTYARAILWVPTRDVTGGFRMWSRNALSNLPVERIKSNGYAFQVETLYISHRLGYKITEIPIYFAERVQGISKMSLRIQIEAAFRVIQIRLAYRDISPEGGS